MSHKCSISGVSRQTGNRVSHAKNRTKHVFLANIQSKKIFLPQLNKTVRIKVSTQMIRTIDKLGIEGALKKYNLTLVDILPKSVYASAVAGTPAAAPKKPAAKKTAAAKK